jgi:hypothetical protein
VKRFVSVATATIVSVGMGLLGFGCGDGKPPEAPVGPPKATSGSNAEQYFPLEAGKIYAYAVIVDDSPDQGMTVFDVQRSDATHGKLVAKGSKATKNFVYSPEGVARDTGVFILKTPIEVGTSWPGEHGGTTRITSIDASVKVIAGSYASCVQTTEDGGRVGPAKSWVTTYCPGVGIVLLEVKGEGRIELKSYAAPIQT